MNSSTNSAGAASSPLINPSGGGGTRSSSSSSQPLSPPSSSAAASSHHPNTASASATATMTITDTSQQPVEDQVLRLTLRSRPNVTWYVRRLPKVLFVNELKCCAPASIHSREACLARIQMASGGPFGFLLSHITHLLILPPKYVMIYHSCCHQGRKRHQQRRTGSEKFQTMLYLSQTARIW